jgi:hypothetical protein
MLFLSSRFSRVRSATTSFNACASRRRSFTSSEVAARAVSPASRLLYQRLRWLTHGGFPNRGGADSSWRGEIRAMPSAVRLREDYSAEELRASARRSKNANQSRRLLSLAAVRDGMDRGAAAKIGGMDRQTLRNWVHRFNGSGGPHRQLDGGSQASPFGGPTGSVRADRRGGSGS